MGDERDFKLKITGDASSLTRASQESADSLGQVEEKTKDSAGAHKEAERAVHGHAKGHRELHKAMHLVMEESPVLGLLLKTALSPVGGALMGAIVLFQQVSKEVEELNKRLEEMETSAAKPIGDFKEAVREANEEVMQGQRAFANWLEGMDQFAGKAKEETDEAIEKLEQETRATQELIKAKAELDKARVEEAVKQGAITEAEGTLKKAEIDTSLAHALAGNEQSELKQRFKLQADALMSVSGQRMQIGDAVDHLQMLANDPERALRIKNAEKHLSSLAEQAGGETEIKQAVSLRDAKAQAIAANDKAEYVRAHNPFHEGSAEYGRAKAVADAEQTRVDNMVAAQREMAKERELISNLKVEQDEWNKKLELAKKDYSETVQAFDTLSKALESTRVKLASFTQTTPQLLAMGDETRQAQAGAKLLDTPQGKMIRDVSNAEYALQHGQKISATQRSQIQALQQTLDAAHENGSMILQVLGRLHGDQEALKRQMLDILKKVGNSLNHGT